MWEMVSSFFEHVVGIGPEEPSHFSPRNGYLPRTPPLRSHVPGVPSIDLSLRLACHRLPDVPAPSAQVLDRPSDALVCRFAVSEPLSKLFSHLKDLEWVCGGEKERAGFVKEIAWRDGRYPGDVEIVDGGRGPGAFLSG